MRIRAIIADLDGTITKFNLDYVATRRRALEELEKIGLRTPEMTEQVNLYVILDKLKDNLDPGAFSKLRATLYSFFEEMELKSAQEVVLYPGAEETLRKLRAQSLKIGLVTSNSRSGTRLTLKRYHMDDLFDAVVTRDDCEQMKPDSAPIKKVLAQLRVPAEAAILVGDGAMDIMAAKGAGVRSVAVSTGPFPIERILKAEPDYLLGSINDLPSLIQRLK